MKHKFVVISSVGPNRDPSKGTREQPFWDEHEAFIDDLVDQGFIFMGGPLVEESGLPCGALLIVNADDENEVDNKDGVIDRAELDLVHAVFPGMRSE